MKQKHKTQKGFTLIELLMVVALIAILSTMILVMLDSGREKAEVNRYVSYATQMYRLVADSAAAGQFDSGKIGTAINAGDTLCLGDVGYNCDGGATTIDNDIYKALTYLTEMPETTKDNAFSPYDKTQGVYMTYKPAITGGDANVVRVHMYLIEAAGNTTFIKKVCDSMGWGVDGDSCYADVPLHSRL
ncbi:MAG: type II secretion system protein [Patescibacteria group bacterium]|nr:type II secretion system protein [Patescibacteria group bacterium]